MCVTVELADRFWKLRATLCGSYIENLPPLQITNQRKIFEVDKVFSKTFVNLFGISYKEVEAALQL